MGKKYTAMTDMAQRALVGSVQTHTKLMGTSASQYIDNQDEIWQEVESLSSHVRYQKLGNTRSHSTVDITLIWLPGMVGDKLSYVLHAVWFMPLATPLLYLLKLPSSDSIHWMF